MNLKPNKIELMLQMIKHIDDATSIGCTLIDGEHVSNLIDHGTLIGIKNAIETLTDKLINDIMMEQRRETALKQGKHYENTTIPLERDDSYDEVLSGLSTGTIDPTISERLK